MRGLKRLALAGTGGADLPNAGNATSLDTPRRDDLAKAFTYCCVQRRNPVSNMTDSTSRFGFVAFAETWNGRLAMLGFVIGLGTELLTGQGILSQIGLG